MKENKEETLECPRCKVELDEGDEFCYNCKKKLNWENEEIEEEEYENLKGEIKLDTKNADKVEIDIDDDLIFITVGMYKMFMKLEFGGDAFLLYSHLMFTARRQKTNSVYAKDVYLKKGLGWGGDKVKRTKSILKKMGLIEYIRRVDPKTGKFTEVYIKLIHLWPLKTLEKRVHKLIKDRKLKKMERKKV